MEVKAAFKIKICPRCGIELKKHNTHIICSGCKFNYFLNPAPCCGIILKNALGEIMLVKRAIEPKKGLWDVPGGFLENSETFEQSIQRECKEELGIEINTDDLKYVTSCFDTYNYKGIESPTIGAMFEANIADSIKIKPADDVASYKFFNLNQLPTDKFSFPWMKRFFEIYI